MATTADRLGKIELITQNQASAYTTHNIGVEQLANFYFGVISILATPPGSPSEGDSYIIGTGASGVWSGFDDAIALFQNGAWLITTPVSGWQIRVAGVLYLYTTSWGVDPSGGATNFLSLSDTPGSFLGNQRLVAEVNTAENAIVFALNRSATFQGLYIFDTATSNTPLAGEIRIDNATPASATNLYLHEQEINGNISTFVPSSIAVGDLVAISDSLSVDGYIYTVTATPSLAANVWTIPVSSKQIIGTLSDDEAINFSIVSGQGSPLTTAGDLVGHDGSSTIRVAGGSQGQKLEYDTAQSSNFKWTSHSKILVNEESLSTTKTLTVNDANVQALDPNGGDRDVVLPDPPVAGLYFRLLNTDAANNDLDIKETAAGAVQTTLDNNTPFIDCHYTGTQWILL